MEHRRREGERKGGMEGGEWRGANGGGRMEGEALTPIIPTYAPTVAKTHTPNSIYTAGGESPMAKDAGRRERDATHREEFDRATEFSPVFREGSRFSADSRFYKGGRPEDLVDGENAHQAHVLQGETGT
jgi:hypothetical protein